VRAGAKELLNDLGFRVVGFDLPRIYPEHRASNNVAVAIILLNLEVQRFLNTASSERDLLSTEELERAYEHMDELIDNVAQETRRKGKREDG